MALLQTPGVHPLAPNPNVTLFHTYAVRKGYSDPETMLAERILAPLEMLAKQLKMTGYYLYKSNLTILLQMIGAELNKYGLEVYINYRAMKVYVYYEYLKDEVFMPDLSGLYFQTDIKVKKQGYRLLQRLKDIGFDKITDNEMFQNLTDEEYNEVEPELLLEKEFNEAINAQLHSIPNFFYDNLIGKTEDPDDKKLNELVKQAFEQCDNIYNIQWLRKDFHHTSENYRSVVDYYNLYHSFDGFGNSLPYSTNKQATLAELGELELSFLTHSIMLSKDQPLNLKLFANYGKSIFESITKLADLVQGINRIYYRKEHKAINSCKWVADLRKCRRPSKRQR